MRVVLIFLIVSLVFLIPAISQVNRFEKSGGTETSTYSEVIEWWKQADKKSGIVRMHEMGPTDSGYPLHLVLVSNDKTIQLNQLKDNSKSVILINNGIHSGEPDGIDASMILVKNIMSGKMKLPNNIILAIVPVYNIAGALNRSGNYRVDQNGPEEFGFRGNARNLDLNRDFIKSDSRNARSFAKIFHLCMPDIFIDNHVSNGADYQHVMTLLSTQHSKLGGAMGTYLKESLEPGIYSKMKEKGYDLVPYVNIMGNTPEKGWNQFFDAPRYSSGYTTLWQSFGFMPETHMLKPYRDRVASTLALMEVFIDFTSKNSESIRAARMADRETNKSKMEFAINWRPDRSRQSEITLKGYEAAYKKSEVSDLERLYYGRTKPFSKTIPFFDHYQPTITIRKPKAYIIPQGWWNVIELLKLNNVQMKTLSKDTTIEVTMYRIDDYVSSASQYEMHHPNSKVEIRRHSIKKIFRRGDYLTPMDQLANRFIIEVLEPQGVDSYFSWNFFDAILGEKEHFSDYVFEETAAALLVSDPKLKSQLEEKKRSDSSFAKSAGAQLDFIYRNSKYFEPEYRQYPVYRVEF